ncbi:MAG: hypothetical protein R3F61_33060 [Myxococcota bacterium]
MFVLWVAAAAAADLTGTWRLDLHLVHDVRVPVLGHSPSDSYTVQLWTVADGVLENEHCSIVAVTRRRIGKPTIPEPFVRNIRHATAPIELDGDRFRVDLGTATIGYVGDAVPTEPTDPTLVDHESDGNPGATIRVWAPLFGDVEVYVAQRTHLVLVGTVEGDAVTGQARQEELVQHTLGAANRLFAQQPNVTPVLDESTFALTRVPAGTTCADPRMEPVEAAR